MRPENRTPPQVEIRATSEGNWPDFSHFVPIFDSEDVLSIFERK